MPSLRYIINGYLISGKILEQGDGGVEEADKLVFGLIIGVADRVQGRVTGSVLAPFVFPDQHVSLGWK